MKYILTLTVLFLTQNALAGSDERTAAFAEACYDQVVAEVSIQYSVAAHHLEGDEAEEAQEAFDTFMQDSEDFKLFETGCNEGENSQDEIYQCYTTNYVGESKKLVEQYELSMEHST